MNYETLQTIWFLLIAILWIGFFLLEGFDFGVGMLMPFLSKKDNERRAMINAIGPHWDGNEVWLLTAGGATFAAFPHWYATLFSGLYPALFLLLLGLIVRGVAFEFRSKDPDPRWRSLWDWAIMVGSFLSALLLGVAFANFAKGLPIDADMNYTGNFFTLLNPYGLLGGLMTVSAFLLHGAIFLSMKIEGEIGEHAHNLAKKIWWGVIVLTVLMLVATYFYTNLVDKLGVDPGIIPIVGLLATFLSGYFVNRKMNGWAFVMTSLMIVFTLATAFSIMFPNVMISSTNPVFSLTIYNASSSAYTLKVLTIIALTFTPIVLAYQGWSYWVFRKRVKTDPKTLTY